MGIFHAEKEKVVFQAEGGIFAKSFLMARDASGKLEPGQVGKGVRGSLGNWTFFFRPWEAIKCFKRKSEILDLGFREKKILANKKLEDRWHLPIKKKQQGAQEKK